jgi:hypothetical protein
MSGTVDGDLIRQPCGRDSGFPHLLQASIGQGPGKRWPHVPNILELCCPDMSLLLATVLSRRLLKSRGLSSAKTSAGSIIRLAVGSPVRSIIVIHCNNQA